MDNILSDIYGIDTVSFVSYSNTVHSFCFSSKMLANQIFIEHQVCNPSGGADYEDLDDEDEVPEDFGFKLSVIMLHESKYYEFLMYHNSMEIGMPVVLINTIITLREIIDKADPSKLIGYLSDLSPDPLIPHTIESKEHREAANELIMAKLDKVHSLLSERKAILN